MRIDPLTLESRFEISKLKLYLQHHPENSQRAAINSYENFLALTQAYKKLLKKYKSLESEYSEIVDLIAAISDTEIDSKSSPK